MILSRGELGDLVSKVETTRNCAVSQQPSNLRSQIYPDPLYFGAQYDLDDIHNGPFHTEYSVSATKQRTVDNVPTPQPTAHVA